MKLSSYVVAGALLVTFGVVAPFGCANSTPDDGNPFGTLDASGDDDDASGHDAMGAVDSTAGDASHPTDASIPPSDATTQHDASIDAATFDANSGDSGFGNVDASPLDAQFDGPCGPGNCGWCCTSAGVCLTGPSDTQCGANGESCTDCTSSGLVCNTSNGTCGACGPGTCANGCCSATGLCIVGDNTACGTGGGACTDCTLTGDVCTSGICEVDGGILDPDCEFDCAGCCDSNSFCHPTVTDTSCGNAGAACRDCTTTSATCIGGFCALADGAVEDPNCADDCLNGCCDALGICHTDGSTNTQCGTGGGTCLDCTVNGGTCSGGMCDLPDGAVQDPNCLEDCDGCCDLGNVCQPGTSRTACGEFSVCQNCELTNQVCVANTCQ